MTAKEVTMLCCRWASLCFGVAAIFVRTVAAESVPGALSVKAIAAGGTFSLVLASDGTVWAWGDNSEGQLGNGTVAPTEWVPPVPAQVGGLTGVTAIAAGYGHSLALKADGTVWVWGNDGAFAILQPTPVQAGGIANVQAIAAGRGTSLAVKSDGTVWAWGPNALGQLGDGTTADRAAPVQVAGLSEVAAITAAGSSSAAAKRDGTVWGWGAAANQFDRTWSLPARVPPLGSPDLAIAMSHSGDFVVGGQGVYSIGIANTGRMATSGVITLTDTLPPGLTFVSAIGNGWTCTVANRIITCTNPGPITPGASSLVTLTVRVESQAWPGVTNLATVSNESDLDTWNNTTGDPAVVLPKPL
jgi:uncharacterized repeat protein (TIGR01451 family)